MDSVTITVLVIFGVIAVIESANLLIKMPSSNSTVLGFTAVLVLDSEDDVSLRLDDVLHKIRWADDNLIKKIIVIDYGMTAEQKSICEEYCTENSLIEVVKPENALNLIISSEKLM